MSRRRWGEREREVAEGEGQGVGHLNLAEAKNRVFLRSSEIVFVGFCGFSFCKSRKSKQGFILVIIYKFY